LKPYSLKKNNKKTQKQFNLQFGATKAGCDCEQLKTFEQTLARTGWLAVLADTLGAP